MAAKLLRVINIVLILLTALLAGFRVANALATSSVHSNAVITKVGNPSGPPPTSPTGLTFTCPLDPVSNSNFVVICGTSDYPEGGCGHGVPPVYPDCDPNIYAVCPFSEQLKKAVDVKLINGETTGAAVYLPFANGNEVINWKFDSGTSIYTEGDKMEFTADYSSHNLRIDLTHLNQDSPISSPNADGLFPSGTEVGTVFDGDSSGLGGGSHLHTAIQIDGVWVEPEKDVQMCGS